MVTSADVSSGQQVARDAALSILKYVTGANLCSIQGSAGEGPAVRLESWLGILQLCFPQQNGQLQCHRPSLNSG